jgi:hypothetical protein
VVVCVLTHTLLFSLHPYVYGHAQGKIHMSHVTEVICTHYEIVISFSLIIQSASTAKQVSKYDRLILCN